MAKVEQYTCDLCGKPSTMELTLLDRRHKKEVKKTDLCVEHFERLRAFIRHGCPPVSLLPLDVSDGK